MSVIKPVIIKNVMVCKADRSLYHMYEDMFKPLVDICRKFDATLDLTMPRQPIVINTTAKCRRAIRSTYGMSVCNNRVGNIMYLEGF